MGYTRIRILCTRKRSCCDVQSCREIPCLKSENDAVTPVVVGCHPGHSTVWLLHMNTLSNCWLLLFLLKILVDPKHPMCRVESIPQPALFQHINPHIKRWLAMGWQTPNCQLLSSVWYIICPRSASADERCIISAVHRILRPTRNAGITRGIRFHPNGD